MASRRYIFFTSLSTTKSTFFAGKVTKFKKYDDYFLDKVKSEKEYFDSYENNELIEAMDNLDDMSLLEKMRYISPY